MSLLIRCKLVKAYRLLSDGGGDTKLPVVYRKFRNISISLSACCIYCFYARMCSVIDVRVGVGGGYRGKSVKWTCNVCSYYNTGYKSPLNECEVCKSPRGKIGEYLDNVQIQHSLVSAGLQPCDGATELVSVPSE